MRGLAVILICVIALCGCGIAARQQAQQQVGDARNRAAAGLQECEAKHPPATPKIAVRRAECINQALALLRPTIPYPDLLDVFMASHMSIAERYQNGQLTFAQANEMIAQKRSEITAEEHRRVSLDRAVAAQQQAASAQERASRGTTCTRFGNTVTCF